MPIFVRRSKRYERNIISGSHPHRQSGGSVPRGVQTLQEADFIAAEDTRVSMKLLNHFDIKKPLVSYHEHNRPPPAGHSGPAAGRGDVCAGDGRRDPCHQ